MSYKSFFKADIPPWLFGGETSLALVIAYGFSIPLLKADHVIFMAVFALLTTLLFYRRMNRIKEMRTGPFHEKLSYRTQIIGFIIILMMGITYLVFYNFY